MTTRSRRLAALLATFAVALAACGGAASPSPAATPTAAATATAAPTETPTATPLASEAPAASETPAASEAPAASIAIPSFTADKDLEAVLPGTFGGVSLTKMSFKGSDLVGSSSDLAKVIADLGVSADGVSVAMASDATGGLKVQFVAMRFSGADPARLLSVYVQAATDNGSPATKVSLGGKDVQKTDQGDGTFSYVYVKSDMLLGVNATSDAEAGPAIAVMP